MKAAVAPITRRKLYQQVAERIEALIRDGRHVPGDQLPSEREFMEMYGVGRSAVREAMLSLQRMGLVRVSSGERARVTEPTAASLVGELSGAARMMLAQPDGVRLFQQARALFEIGLARHAALHATAKDLKRLKALLDANRAAIGNRDDFIRTDVGFHYALAEISNNPIMTSLYDAIVEWLTEQREISGRARNAGEIAYRAHERIYKAIAARDPMAAQQAMQSHLDKVAQFYWKMRPQAEDAG
jgi:DNA-binding FadR family transcriptional regulator